MFSLLLAIIYMAFISLGLPDSLLGSAWPIMRLDLSAPLSFAGIISMIIAGGTIVSSLFSDKLTRKLGTGLVTAISVGMTAAALFGFSVSDSILPICLWSVPYGLGAGAVDAALNNYVALHYSSRHMSWLHCFWGVGASISPYIMSASIGSEFGWRGGYSAVSIIQAALTIGLFAALPLWRGKKSETEQNSVEAKPLGLVGVFKIKGVPQMLAAFFCYCSLETTAGLWASSYLAEARGTAPETAAMFASLFYFGITAGRFLNGFIADKAGDRRLIRLGIIILSGGAALVALPISSDIPALVGMVIIGLGCAPVYPSIIHATPSNFGKENSQAIVGIQMASAYCGSTFIPPLFGALAGIVGLWLFPFFIIFFAALAIIMTELLNKITRKNRQI